MTEQKFEKLKGIIADAGKLAVGFSGGVDSAFLCAVTRDVLGKENSLAVTISSQVLPKRELAESKKIAAHIGIKQIIVESDCTEDEQFSDNPPDRCYHCKKDEFGEIIRVAMAEGFEKVADGSNADDADDYRPGMKAVSELDILSPLKEAGLTKNEIRALSKKMGVPGFERPAAACLASRIPYGMKITSENLSSVERAEGFLKDMGFEHVRVRHHGDVARIEVPRDLLDRILEVRQDVVKGIRECGFTHVALDLEGYRTGSLNESLEISESEDRRDT